MAQTPKHITWVYCALAMAAGFMATTCLSHALPMSFSVWHSSTKSPTLGHSHIPSRGTDGHSRLRPLSQLASKRVAHLSTAAPATATLAANGPALAATLDMNTLLNSPLALQAQGLLENDENVQAARKYLESDPRVQSALQESQGWVQLASANLTLVEGAAAVTVLLAICWAFRRSILWRLAQLQGRTKGDDIVLDKYRVKQLAGRKGNGSAFGLVTPVWNRKELLAFKVSRDLESWTRETDVYRRLQGGGGCIIQLYDAKQDYDGYGSHVLVQEYGNGDLLDYIKSTGPLPLKEVRRIGLGALDAISKMHAAGLVWCDCKPENFVFVNGQLKAIDLETATREGVDVFGYSPETAPPEIAVWRGVVDVEDIFPARKSFDMWSLGMLLLHAYKGSSYWGTSGPQNIMRRLREPDFEVDLSGIRDTRFRNLLKRLLRRDPKQRPSAFAARLDPFFLLP